MTVRTNALNAETARRLERLVLRTLAAYPFVDVLLRRLPVPVLPSLWDEAVLLLGLGLVWRRTRLGRGIRPSPLLRPLGIFLAVAAAATLADPRHLDLGLEGLRATFQYALALVVAQNLVDDLAEVRRLALTLVGLGTAAALAGIYQYVTGAPMPEHWVSVTETVRTRAYAVVGSPNGLGDYLALLTPLALGLAFDPALRRRRPLLLAAAGVLAFGLLVTFSRGAWLALAASMGFLALSLDRRLLAALLAGALLLTAAVPPVRDRVGQLASAHYWERSLVPGGRLYRWNAAYERMAHAPVRGTGLGQFGGAVAARRLGTQYTDNYYAKTLAETGIPGLVAFLALMAAALRTGGHAVRALAGRPERFLAHGLRGALLVIVLHNFVENIFEIPFLNAYFWMIAAFASRLPDLAGAGPAPAATPATPPAAPAGGSER